MFVFLAASLASCGSSPASKSCDPHAPPSVRLSVNSSARPVVRLLAGQSIGFSDAVGWSFAASDGRVLEEDDCPGGTSFRALQPGSSLLRASWGPNCHPACGMPSRLFETTVIVDRATPFLPAVTQSTFASSTIALLSVGQTVEVAMPADFQYKPWQHTSISDPRVLQRVDVPISAGLGLVVLQATQAGLADLTADAHLATSSFWEAGFFRVEFVVRDPASLADSAASQQDGKSISLKVGEVLKLSQRQDASVAFQSADRNQPLLLPLQVPVVDQEDNGIRYFIAQAAGSEEICWLSCVAAAGVTVNVIPSARGIRVEATDSDGQKRFTLRLGKKIRLTLHPYIGPWKVVASSDVAVLRPTGDESSNGLQVWTFTAVAPGSAILSATYPCPSGEACPLEPSIRVDVATA
jgi:hypothetical protein